MIFIRRLLSMICCLMFLNAHGQFHAIHIPTNRLAKLKIDGSISDWTWVSPEKYMSRKFLTDFVDGPKISEVFWDCKFIVAWSEITNRIYIVSIVDNKKKNISFILQNASWWFNDCMEVMTNPTSNVVKGHAVKSHFTFPVLNKKDEVTVDIGPEWFGKNESEITFGGGIIKGRNGLYTVVYEVSMSLWDRWSDKGIEFSKRHYLSSEQLIRLSLWFDNDLYQADKKLVQWSTSRVEKAYLNPFNLSQFILDAPDEKKVLWENIKGILKPRASN